MPLGLWNPWPIPELVSQGFRKKRHWVDKFSTRLSLSVRSMPCLFQTCTNDICWLCLKPQTNQVKLKISPGNEKAKFSLDER